MADATSRQQLRAQAVDAYKKSGKYDILTYPEGEPDAVTITDSDMDGLQPGEYLSDNIIDFYIKYLQKTRLTSTDRGRFYFFNSFFFRKLLENSSASTGSDECSVDFRQLRKWTQGVDLFEKEYIFIPVICRSHWSLILICHLTSMKQSRVEESKPPPCIYHLDSISGRHESFKNEMKSYLFEAWMDGRDIINKDQFDQMRALTCMRYVETKVPQQDNKHDCGIYLLQYVENILDALIASNELTWELSRLETCFAKWSPAKVYEKRMSMRMLIVEMSGVQEITFYLKPCKNQGISKQRNGDLEQKGIACALKLMKNMVPVMEESEGVVEVEAQRDIEMECGEHYNNGEMELDLLNSHPKDYTNIEHVEHGRDKELDLRRSRVRIEDLHHKSTSADVFNSKDEQLHDIVSPQSHVSGNGRAWKWTREATQVLLECMVKGDVFYKESKKATNWDRISWEIMNRSGERPSDKQCRLRYDTLLKAYKVMKEFCKKNVKSFGEITSMEQKELRLSTTLHEEWYSMIEKISSNVRHDQKHVKRRKLSPSIENGHPLEMLVTSILLESMEDERTWERQAIIASELSRFSEARRGDSEKARFRLRFKNKLAFPIISEDVLTSEKGDKLIVNLEDVDTGEIVTTGLWASAELEVVVLTHGLRCDDKEKWTQQDFEKHICHDALSGKLDIQLMNGEGLLGAMWFTYFGTLGLRQAVELVVRVSPKNCVGFRVQEARTEAFEVFSQYHMKRYPPTLGSEVWTLQNVEKCGSFHKACNEMGIFTVEELLQQKAMGVAFPYVPFEEDTWEHAMTCKPSGKIRRYAHDGRVIVFNHLFQAIGLMEENGPFRHAQSLSYNEKKLMEGLIPEALRSWKHVTLDEELILPKTATER